jgi:hypothetical protein
MPVNLNDPGYGGPSREVSARGLRPVLGWAAASESKPSRNQHFNFLCFHSPHGRGLAMTSLQRHGPREAHKQLHLRMQRSGLSSIKVHVTSRAGKIHFHFTGSDEEVKKAEKILADWA